ncbi:MAG: PKD domain-containing protein [Methanomassiliicoccales archaeon]
MKLGLANPLCALLAVLILFTGLNAPGTNDHVVSTDVVSKNLEVTIDLGQYEVWTATLDVNEHMNDVFWKVNEYGIMFPCKSINILLPPDAIFLDYRYETVSPIWIRQNSWATNFGKIYPINDTNKYELKESLPAVLARLPGVQVEFGGVHRLEGLPVATFCVCPVSFELTNNSVIFSKMMKIRCILESINVERDDRNENILGWISDDLRQRIENPDMLDRYFDPYSTYLPAKNLDTSEYVIITDENMKGAFLTLKEWKESRGSVNPRLRNLTTRIVTVEWIKSSRVFWGDPESHSEHGNDTQTKIRNFIKFAHYNWATKYVLLGGDDELLPCRKVFVKNGLYQAQIPADIYYAGLDGEWDNDGDGVYGEGDGDGGGANGEEADLLAEVYVGRAPVSTVYEAHNFVSKTIAYETSQCDDWLNRIVLVGNKLDNYPTWGGDYKDEVAESTFPASDPDLDILRLYERDRSFSTYALTNAINQGIHILNHIGHGSVTSFADLDINDVRALTNNRYFLLYTQACDVGAFDLEKGGETDSIVEHFVAGTHGAFAAIANSRYGWYTQGSTEGPSQKFDIEFFDSIFNERIRNLGHALADSKEDLLAAVASTGPYRWAYMSLNLLGDPETEVHFVESRSHDIAITGIQCDECYVGEKCNITAIVTNLGSNTEFNLPIELIVDGELIAANFLNLSPQSSSILSFSWTCNMYSPVLIQIRANATFDKWKANDEMSSWCIPTLKIKENYSILNENVTLSCNVLVEETGQFYVENSTIMFSWNRTHEFTILVCGMFVVENSKLTTGGFAFYSISTTGNSDVSFLNSTIRGFSSCSGRSGIEIEGSLIINHCILESPDGSVNINNTSHAVVANTIILGSENGISMSNSTGSAILNITSEVKLTGIEIKNSSGIAVIGCVISGSSFGIVLSYSKNLSLIDNKVSNNKYDFIIYGSSRDHFIHNLSGNFITSGPLTYLYEEKNKEFNPDKLESGAFIIIDCTNLSIESFTFSHNGFGALIINSIGIKISNCSFHHNLFGIRSINSADCFFFRNDFCMNEISAMDNGNNHYNLEYPLGGNYWDDYRELDLKSGPQQNINGSDGIGDTPKYISGGLCADQYPFLTPLTDASAPPIVSFFWSPSEPTTFEIVRFFDESTDHDGTIVNWTWDFGDGVFSYDRNPMHIYSRSGVYNVTLRVRDNEAIEVFEIEKVKIRNTPPVADFSYSPDSPRMNETVVFAQRSYDLDGYIEAFTWDFGDGGNSTNPSPIHVYQKRGVYNVTLSVMDNDGESSFLVRAIAVGNVKPVARINCSSFKATINNAIQFIDESFDIDGTVIKRSWDFGDGSTSIDKNPLHLYSAKGIFCVTLTVWDDMGASNTSGLIVSIENLPPSALFSWFPESPCGGADVFFIDKSYDPDGYITSYYWEFGDGISSSLRNPSHRYNRPGEFVIYLTVVDDSGAQSKINFTITVKNSPPIAQFEIDPLDAKSLQPIHFYDFSIDPDGYIIEWKWSFGDGTYSSERNSTHVYLSPGRYEITLFVKDDLGRTNSSFSEIIVRNLPPVCDFGWQIIDMKHPTTITFTDLSYDPDGLITSYKWHFGDGSTSLDATPIHTYSKEGEYRVRLTITDNFNESRFLEQLVQVKIPDLIIFSAIEIFPNYPERGEDISITVYVRNAGIYDLHNISLSFMVDDYVFRELRINMQANDTRAIVVTWTSTEGAHFLKITVDGENAVAEISEFNNVVSTRIIVKPGTEIASYRLEVWHVLIAATSFLILFAFIYTFKRKGKGKK